MEATTGSITLANMRSFYNSGATRSYDFRKKQLEAFKRAVIAHEEDIYHALYADLKKSKEECYATENGLLITELNIALKSLRQWMKPKSARTNLLNFPSSSKIYRDPLGVVLIISPWNYPLQLLLIPLVGAIAAGNCIVLKPSELAPATAHLIKRLISSVFSEDYIKVVEGNGAAVIPALMENFRFDHVCYTGSTAVGKIIYQLAAKSLTPVTLELGGKSPAIVENDADIRTAARRIALGKFANAGQTCIAPDYVLVHKQVADQFIHALQNVLTSFYGTNAGESYDYGKIINAKQFDRLITYLQQGNIVFGGQTDRDKLFIAPAIVTNISTTDSIMQDEIFGPILPVLTFDTTAGAEAIVRQNPQPLAFYIFTSNATKEKQWIEQFAFGGGCVNNTIWQFANHHLPFGGIGNSGTGAYHGKFTFQTFTHAKPVMKTPLWFDPSVKYPSFKGKLKLFKWLFR